MASHSTLFNKIASLTVSFIKAASWLAKSDLELWKKKKSVEKNKRDLIVNGRCLFLKIFWSSLSVKIFLLKQTFEDTGTLKYSVLRLPV